MFVCLLASCLSVCLCVRLSVCLSIYLSMLVQRDALASAIAGIGSAKGSKATSNRASRTSLSNSSNVSQVPSLQNSPRELSLPPAGIGKFSRQASVRQQQKVEKILAEQQQQQQMTHSADVYQIGNGKTVHVNGTVPITTWIELYNFAASSWNPRYPLIQVCS